MGSVHNEQVNEGRGTHETFDYVTFSEPRMVEALLRNRHKCDAAFSQREVGEDGAAAMVFNEQILATYISLDALIKAANLTPPQQAVITQVMRGWTGVDIAEYYDVSPQAVSAHFIKAVKRIVAANNERWRQCFAEAGDKPSEKLEEPREETDEEKKVKRLLIRSTLLTRK